MALAFRGLARTLLTASKATPRLVTRGMAVGIQDIKAAHELETATSDTSVNGVVIDFSAEWCGPCKFVTPVLDELAAKNKNVKFVKVDIDALPDVAAAYDIRAVPTLHFYKDGSILGVVQGADVVGITHYVDTISK